MSTIKDIKAEYIANILSFTKYKWDTPMGKALRKDLKKLNMATLGILSSELKGIKSRR